MTRLVVSEFVTLDGVFEDPGGAEAAPHGGWALRLTSSRPAGETVILTFVPRGA